VQSNYKLCGPVVGGNYTNDLDGVRLRDLRGKEVAHFRMPEAIRASTTPGSYAGCLAFSHDGLDSVRPAFTALPPFSSEKVTRRICIPSRFRIS
jgi:hypothetical protein